MPHPNEPTQLESDQRAELAALWAQSQHLVEAFLRTVITDPHDRDDVLQEAARQAARDFSRYDSDRPFANWVVAIARHKVVDLYRKKTRDTLMLKQRSAELLASAFESVQQEATDRSIALDRCFAKLQPHHRKLLKLRYADDLQVQEIAGKIGARPNTVTVTLRRVREALADCIERQLNRQEGGRDA